VFKFFQWMINHPLNVILTIQFQIVVDIWNGLAINIALPSLSFLIGKNYHQNVQGYPVSKVLAEKAAWKFAEENNIDLITVIPTLTIGPSLTQDIPSSVAMGMSLLTGSKQPNSMV